MYLSVRSVAFRLTVSGDLDDKDSDPGEQQHRNPATRRNQPKDNPGKYQPYADPPQHQGISFNL